VQTDAWALPVTRITEPGGGTFFHYIHLLEVTACQKNGDDERDAAGNKPHAGILHAA
jgi:hypothetical protein